MQRILGGAIIGVAVLTASVGLFGAVLGGQLVTAMGVSLGDGLTLTADALASADTTISVAHGALEDVAVSLDQLATTSLIVGGTLENSHDLLAEVAVITGEDLPSTIEAFRGAMPGLIRAASAIDTTLRALNLFTIDDYDPEVPLDEAIAQLDEGLAEMPGKLRRQAVLLSRANDGMVGVTQQMYETAAQVVELRMALTSAVDVLAAYETTTTEARQLVADVSAQIDRQVPLAKTAIVLAGVMLAVSQLGSAVLGWLLWSGAVVLPSPKKHHAEASSHPDDVEADEAHPEVESERLGDRPGEGGDDEGKRAQEARD